MRKSEFLMLEALKSAPHLNDSPGYQLVISSILASKCDGSSVIWIQMPIHFILSVANTVFMWEVTSIFDWGTVSPIPNRIVHARPWPRILTDFQRSKPGNVVMSVLWWIHTHTPIHNIKCVANTLFMLCMNVTSIVVGRRAWSIVYQHYSCPSMIKISNNWSTI